MSKRSTTSVSTEVDSNKKAKVADRKVALITGITGQDGSYLTEFLLDKGYEVHGLIRRSSSFNTGRIDHLYKDRHINGVRLHLHFGDLGDSCNLASVLEKVKPTEIYNLGAMSHVHVSFQMAEYTGNVDGLGVLRLLDAMRTAGIAETCRFYQASTSELYGKVQETPQSETTPFYPRSPYAVAKQYAFWICVNYREAYGMHCNNGILFNHESPRRGNTFVTRKITRAVCRIKLSTQDCLYLGNMDSKRDWGHARDYVEAMWMILQADTPDDYVCATGQTQTVRSLVELAFKHVDMEIKWEGEHGSIDEVGKVDGKVVVRIDSAYFRPTEVDLLLGDASKITKALGWKPKTSFTELVNEMMEADMAEAVQEKQVRKMFPNKNP